MSSLNNLLEEPLLAKEVAIMKGKTLVFLCIFLFPALMAWADSLDDT